MALGALIHPPSKIPDDFLSAGFSSNFLLQEEHAPTTPTTAMIKLISSPTGYEQSRNTYTDTLDKPVTYSSPYCRASRTRSADAS